MRSLFERFSFSRKSKRQAAAYNEVIDAFHQDPIAGYGLYHLVNDSGLLSATSQHKLKPYVENVEKRIELDPKELRIQLPMKYVPITDVEHDTLTFVIAQAIREFDRDLDNTTDKLILPELHGVNRILKKHFRHTASISYELDVCSLVGKLLKRCGRRKKYLQRDGSSNIIEGDFFVLSRLRRQNDYFTLTYRNERSLKDGDVVEIATDWGNGYSGAHRLTGETHYTRPWTIHEIQRAISRDSDLVIIHEKEGHFVELLPRYQAAVHRFIQLIRAHDVDKSLDPAIYSPDYDSAI